MQRSEERRGIQLIYYVFSCISKLALVWSPVFAPGDERLTGIIVAAQTAC